MWWEGNGFIYEWAALLYSFPRSKMINDEKEVSALRKQILWYGFSDCCGIRDVWERISVDYESMKKQLIKYAEYT